jgi:hypothetical protein
MSRTYTDEQICRGIAKAIKAHDNEALVDLIALLACQSPHLAQQVYDAITRGEVTITIPIGARS